ncbi:MAG: radical SAM protein [Candidatus Omnitrophica bacterium]|nr:radical SAM protein [Candidatus Omnitrophota bacterium]
MVSDGKGNIFDIPSMEAAGMKGGGFFRLVMKEMIKLPYGSELFMLPGRRPVGYDSGSKTFSVIEKFFPIAAFVSPGHTTTYNAAYAEDSKVEKLPLFSYGAVMSYKGGFYTAAIKVDRELRQDLRFMDMEKVRKNIKRFRRIFPHNRLIRHLEGCALVNSCPAAKNLFLQRYEAPLPTSPYCNARCLGCISHQPQGTCSITQPRIKFVPSPQEIAETALFHIKEVRDPVVSFGQGCEGEPLLVSDVILESIKLIRRETSKGIININTNASRPRAIGRLFDAGLDSIRVSMNSVQSCFYTTYYKCVDYGFKDVLSSIETAKRSNGFVSLNYLVMPGFTDSKYEFNALRSFIDRYKIDMIQWRNLNYDPVSYFKELHMKVRSSQMFGISQVICSIKRSYPGLLTGYFNPSRARMKRFKV